MTAGVMAEGPRTSPVARDRGAYFFLTLWLLALAVIGFAPKSAGILAGAVPNPPLAVHLHAVTMVAWLGLLVAQAGLVGAGRRDLHMKLGLTAFALIPTILILAAFTTSVRYYDMVEAGMGQLAANILFLQARFFLTFPVFVIWALAVRRTDPDTHKRLLIVATAMPLGAAFGRMGFLPGNDLMVTNDVASAMEFVALAPALAWDLIRHKRLHMAYVIGTGLALAFAVATHFVWNAGWWQAAADAFMGVG